MHPDRVLVRYGLMEAIVRCARDKFLKQDKYKDQSEGAQKVTTISEAFELMANNHIIPFCEELDYNVSDFSKDVSDPIFLEMEKGSLLERGK